MNKILDLNINQYKLIVFSSFFISVFYNITFFRNLINTYSFKEENYLFFISLFFLLSFLLSFLVSLVSSEKTIKFILIFILMISSFSAYFTDNYNIVIDHNMIRNILETNFNELLDLLSIKLIAYVLFLGVIPSFLIFKINIKTYNLKKSIFQKLISIITFLLLIVIILLSFSKHYTSFFREHKPLRYYVNPTYWIYSTFYYLDKNFNKDLTVLKKIGTDAKITNKNKRVLSILVVGEALRANRVSLNGYEKETTPLLKKENIINFKNFYSCGTSTAHSVPCMFSSFNRKDYTYKKAASTYNILDVLNETNQIDILWRDNNSNSKGVANRIKYEDYKTSKINKIYDIEARDIGMLDGLEDYIKNSKKQNILIVLHQMGNHGPAYYKRYPKEFEKFLPACKVNQLEKCTLEEISNAYDNSTLYTDYFLSKVINFLKPYSKEFDLNMVYMSDHGESLGENGIFLHGMPYFMAPKNQKHIPAFFWLGKKNKSSFNIEKEYSHDNLFSTLLGLYNVKTKIYNSNMDILK